MYLYVRVLKGKHNTHVLDSIAAAFFKTNYENFRTQKIHHNEILQCRNLF